MPSSRRSIAYLAAVSLLGLGSARAALPRFPQPYGDSVVFVADGSIGAWPSRNVRRCG